MKKSKAVIYTHGITQEELSSFSQAVNPKPSKEEREARIKILKEERGM